MWADTCRSWYKNGKETGTVTGPHGGSMLHFKDMLENVGDEHFDFEWRSGNRFRWAGNGMSKRDEGGFGDLAYYMEEGKI